MVCEEGEKELHNIKIVIPTNLAEEGMLR